MASVGSASWYPDNRDAVGVVLKRELGHVLLRDAEGIAIVVLPIYHTIGLRDFPGAFRIIKTLRREDLDRGEAVMED